MDTVATVWNIMDVIGTVGGLSFLAVIVWALIIRDDWDEPHRRRWTLSMKDPD